MIAAQDYSDVAVIAGANVPMLLDTLDYLESDYTLDDMVEELIAAGKDGVKYSASASAASGRVRRP